MAKLVSLGYSDTAVAGNPVLSVTVPTVNWSEDMRLEDAVSDKLLVSNALAGAETPEYFTFQKRTVKDIYSGPFGSMVGADLRLASRAGIQIFVGHQAILIETDDADPTHRKFVPVQFNVGAVLPLYSGVSNSALEGQLKRTLAGLYRQGVADANGIGDLRRGLLRRPGM